MEINLEKFLEIVKQYNEKALYVLAVKVLLSSTFDNKYIDVVWAICPIKEKIYISEVDDDNIRDINFSDIKNVISEKELYQISIQLTTNICEKSQISFIALFN